MKFEFSAGIIVYADMDGERKFLFLKNPHGWWDLPKGHIEKGENAIKAALRETKEEANLVLKPYRSFVYSEDYWFISAGEKIKKNVKMFIAKADNVGDVRISEEHSGYAWMSYKVALNELRYKTQKQMISSANSYISRLEKIDAINAEYANLPNIAADWKLSRRFVPGEGRLNAKVMFIGQAPGAEEDMKLRPFIGRSGKLLDRLIKSAGLVRRNVYITSVVQFFPPENRVPTDDEIILCKPFLDRQIAEINPEIIVLLGSVAAKAVVGLDGIKSIHGRVISGKPTYLVTLHPAAAVRIKSNMPLIEADFKILKSLLKNRKRFGTRQ
ncbi:NUDIX domain-containing protein [Candidatus Marsarchaeota archaeon]|nr:NUDIX domain-containing protein [Candidatus Marsarchaeota archaeon]